MKEQLFLTTIESHGKDLFGPEIQVDVLERIIVPFTGSNVVFATTESGIPLAIKISAIKRGAEREWLGLNKAYNAGVPTPKPLVLARDTEGSAALILEKIEGENLYHHPNDEVKHQLGRIVRLMHENVVVNGDEWAKSDKPDFTYYDRCFFYWIQGSISGLDKDSKTQVLLGKFTDAMKDYCKRVSPVFTHNDIHDGQIFIRKNGSLVLIDFENWKEETQLSELAHYLFHSIRTNRSARGFIEFVHGYLGTTSLTDSEKSVLMFYLLFISARTVSYFQRLGSTYLETAKANHQKILEFVNSESLWKQF